MRDPAVVAGRLARSRAALASLKALLCERLSVVGSREFR
jgi:hypothetical protein